MNQEKKSEDIVEKEDQNQENTSQEPKVSEEVASENVSNEWEEKYNQLNDSHLRLMAEFDNYRKRTLREKSDLIKSAGESVLVNLLPLADDFERGLQALKDSTDVEAVRQGMELIYSKLAAFFQQNGVKAIETEDSEFDTEFHEAITTIPAPTEELKGKIIDCVQKGYLLNDKVIRFAKVVVGE
ncbi:MAG: GrpE protein [Bacteroidetes bacterium]|nr:GrpE protein [Bacteroidota bacterium]